MCDAYMHKIERLEELYSLIDDYMSSREIVKPLVIFGENEDVSIPILSIIKEKKLQHWVISNYPHDSNDNYIFAEPDADWFSYILLDNSINYNCLQFCQDIASRLHKPVFVFAEIGSKGLLSESVIDEAYLFSISFESWMTWAKQIDKYGEANIAPLITDFLDNAGEDDWSEHRPESWEDCSDILKQNLEDLLSMAPNGYDYDECLEKSIDEYSCNGIHYKVLKDALSRIPEEQWREWMSHNPCLMSNYRNQNTMPDGRFIQIEYVPNLSTDEKISIVNSTILGRMLSLSGEKDTKAWTGEWTPRKVDLDMIEYFRIPVHEANNK